MKTLLRQQMPVEIITKKKTVKVEGEFGCELARGLDLTFLKNGRLQVTAGLWMRKILNCRFIDTPGVGEFRHIPGHEFVPEITHRTDNPVSRTDFHVAAAYWGPRDGVVRLTPTAIREAYTEMQKLGLGFSQSTPCGDPAAPAQQRQPFTAFATPNPH